jgi:hypothetical protein
VNDQTDINWVIQSADGDMHFIPLRDVREHEESRDCWCGPYCEKNVCSHPHPWERET